MMTSYTEDQLNFIWQHLRDGTEYEALDDMGALTAAKDETDVSQTLTLFSFKAEVEPYKDFDPPSDLPKDRAIASYTRTRGNKEATWGAWVKNN
jgi:hypothetical protein